MSENSVKIIISVSVLMLLLTSHVVHAEKIMPVFSGDWFDSVIEYNLDSCYVLHPTYKNKEKDKKYLIDKVSKEMTTAHENCTWGQPYLSQQDGTFEPADFPTPNSNDYSEIIAKDKYAPRSEYWKIDCTEPKNGSILDFKLITIQPSYRCPKGSREVFTKDGFKICTTRPTVCFADVVGRDLKGGGGKLGHVGLTLPGNPNTGILGNNVLEVLNQDIVININSLKSFVDSVPNKYWGEAYGLEALDYINLQNAALAISSGVNQIQFNPEYTLTIFWREGGYKTSLTFDKGKNTFVEENNIINAKFRCDTFVNYCYSKGFNVSLPTHPHIAILPISTFKSFLNKRNDIIIDSSDRNVDNILNTLNKTKSNINIPKLDVAISAYLDNQNITRKEKINYIWRIAKQSNLQHFSYLLDTLGYLQANELIPSFIRSYDKEILLDKKLKLITVIAESCLFDNKQMHIKNNFSSTNTKLINNILSAQEFIVELLKFENDPQLLNKAIWSALVILPKNQVNYYIITNALNRLQLLSKEKRLLTEDRKLFIKLSLAFSNNHMQEWLLPKLLLTNKSTNESKIFDNQMILFIKELKPSQISINVKPMLKEYIMTTLSKVKQTGPDHNAHVYDYLFALATINHDNITERNNELLHIALKSDNHLQQAIVISNLEYATLLQLPIQEQLKLSTIFYTFFKNSKDFENAHIYALALSKLNTIRKH